MSKGGILLRSLATVIRAIEFLIAGLVLAIFSWYLACLYIVQILVDHG